MYSTRRRSSVQGSDLPGGEGRRPIPQPKTLAAHSPYVCLHFVCSSTPGLIMERESTCTVAASKHCELHADDRRYIWYCMLSWLEESRADTGHMLSDKGSAPMLRPRC